MKCPVHPDKDHAAYYAEPYYNDGKYTVRCSLKSVIAMRLNQLRDDSRSISPITVGMKDITYEQLKPILDFTAFCLHCHRPGCTLEDARTAYADPNSNLPIWYCPECAVMHHDHWDSMWNDYYSAVMP